MATYLIKISKNFQKVFFCLSIRDFMDRFCQPYWPLCIEAIDVQNIASNTVHETFQNLPYVK